MEESHAHRQREYRERLKEKNPEMYLKRDQDRQRIQREALKKTTKHEDYKIKDRMRKIKQKKVSNSYFNFSYVILSAITISNNQFFF